MSSNPFSLEGKTILITGASSGIGFATAIECSRMGASLFLTGRNEERLQQCLNEVGGGKNEYFIADLVKEDDIENLVNHTPTLDGIVISAGQGITLPIKSATSQKYRNIFDINFFAPVELVRLLIKKKKLKEGSSVVIISSIGGVYQFEPANSIYGTSKAALNSFMRFAAIEFAAKSIRFNTICPGMVETPLMQNGRFTDEQLDAYRESYPLKRFGKPTEIGNAAVFLLSDASSWITGISLIVDGGSTIRG